MYRSFLVPQEVWDEKELKILHLDFSVVIEENKITH
jgi:hypothetical protein